MKTIFIIISLFVVAPMYSSNNNLDGKQLFKTKCKACHSIDQKLVGPALKDVHQRRDSSWLFSFILSSQSLINDGDSTAINLFQEYNQISMPDQPLSKEQIAAILEYIRIASINKNDDQPITRPAAKAKVYPVMFNFSDYIFWIPFTCVVLLLIATLYHLTTLYDVTHNKHD